MCARILDSTKKKILTVSTPKKKSLKSAHTVQMCARVLDFQTFLQVSISFPQIVTKKESLKTESLIFKRISEVSLT